MLPHRKHEPKSKIIKDLKHGEEDYVRFIPGITLAVHDSCHFRDSSRTGFSCDIVRGKNGHTHTHNLKRCGKNHSKSHLNHDKSPKNHPCKLTEVSSHQSYEIVELMVKSNNFMTSEY